MEKEFFIEDLSKGFNDSNTLDNNYLQICKNADLYSAGGITSANGIGCYYTYLNNFYHIVYPDSEVSPPLPKGPLKVDFIYAHDVVINGKNKLFCIARYENKDYRNETDIENENVPIIYYFGYLYADWDIDTLVDIDVGETKKAYSGDIIKYNNVYYRAKDNCYITAKKEKDSNNNDVINYYTSYNEDLSDTDYENPNFINTLQWRNINFETQNIGFDMGENRGFQVILSEFNVQEENPITNNISFAQTKNGVFFSLNNKFYRTLGYDFTSDEGISYIVKGHIVYVNHEEANENSYGKYYKATKDLGLANLLTQDYLYGDWTPTYPKSKAYEVAKGVGDYDYTYLDGTVNIVYQGEVVLGPRYKQTTQNGNIIYTKDTTKLFRYRARRDITGIDSSGNKISFDLANATYYKTNEWENISSKSTIYDENGDGDASGTNSFGEISKCQLFIYHPASKRIFASMHPIDKKAVYYSDINDFTIFRRKSVLYPSFDIGDVKAMKVIGKYLCIGYEKGWYVFDNTKDNFSDEFNFYPLHIPYGVINNNCIISTPGSFTFFTGEKIVKVNKSIFSENVGLSSEKNMIKIISDNTCSEELKKIEVKDCSSMAFCSGKVYLSYNTDKNYKIDKDEKSCICCNNLLEYDFENEDKFNVYDNIPIFSLFVKDDSLYIGSRGIVYNMNIYNKKTNLGKFKVINSNCETVPLNFYLQTKNYDFNEPNVYKRIKRIILYYKQNPSIKENTTFLTLEIEGDGTSKKSYDITCDNGLKFGRKWGNKWGYSDIMTHYLETDVYGVNFKFTLSNNTFKDTPTIIKIGVVYESTKKEILSSISSEDFLLK